MFSKNLEISPYQQAMVQHRWGGSWPESATRVEYQIKKGWLDQYSIGSAAEVLARLRDLIAKVTSEGPRPFLRFTTTVPDRENGHQSRAETLPHWTEIIQAFRSGFPGVFRPLARIERGHITGLRAFRLIRGCLTKTAAQSGESIGGLLDALEYLREMHQRNGGTDEEWQRAWQTHAIKLRTFDSATPKRRIA